MEYYLAIKGNKILIHATTWINAENMMQGDPMAEVGSDRAVHCRVPREAPFNTDDRKEDEIMPLAATWMDLEMITPSEVSQTENQKYHISLLCGI